ncbi:family 4 glycosyl hydrolase C-terminal domain protein, partial [Vibrio parahaemolyticus V-223/04]
QSLTRNQKNSKSAVANTTQKQPVS